MIDLENEEVVSIAEAAKKFVPKLRGGKHVHPTTIFRWTQRGCKGVILESLQCGSTRCTSREALQRFFEKLTEMTGSSSHSMTPAQRRRVIEKVNQQSEENGL